MRGDQRQFQVFDLELAVRKEGGAPPSMLTAAALWEARSQASTPYDINSGDATMIIGDIDAPAGQNYLVMLVRLSDTKAPNSVYSNIDTGDFTEHEKAGRTGADVACHVFISLAEERDQPNVYTCCIERVTGLSGGLIKRILSKFLHQEFSDNPQSFRYPAPGGGLDRDGNPRTERACPHVELRARPSDRFVQDLNEGALTGVKLIKTEAVTPMTGAAYLTKSTSELRLHIVRDNMPAQIWTSLRHMLNHYSQDYGTSQVTYKLAGGGRTVTIDIDNATGTPLNDLYIMTYEVTNIFPPLAQSARSVVPRLRDAARDGFLANRAI